jgi:hypothetical protein
MIRRFTTKCDSPVPKIDLTDKEMHRIGIIKIEENKEECAQITSEFMIHMEKLFNNVSFTTSTYLNILDSSIGVGKILEKDGLVGLDCIVFLGTCNDPEDYRIVKIKIFDYNLKNDTPLIFGVQNKKNSGAIEGYGKKLAIRVNNILYD